MPGVPKDLLKNFTLLELAKKYYTIGFNRDKVANLEKIRKKYRGYGLGKNNARVYANIMFAMIQTMHSLLTDAAMSVGIIPEGKEDEKVVTLLSQYLEYLKSTPHLNYRKKWNRATYRNLIDESVYFKTYVDRSAFGGLGAPGLSVVRMEHAVPDPKVSEIQKGRFFIQKIPVTEDFVAAIKKKEKLGDDKKQPIKIDSAGGGNENYTWWSERIGEFHKRTEDLRFLWEVYLPLVDNYWLTYWVYNGREIVGSPMIVDYFPFDCWTNYAEGDNVGMSEIELGELLATEEDNRRRQVSKNIEVTGNNTVVMQAAEGAFKKVKTSKLGSVGNLVQIPEAAKIYTMPGAELSRALLGSVTENREMLEYIYGIHDVTQGKTPTGVSAWRAIRELRDTGQTRIRDKIREMEYVEISLTQKMIHIIRNYTNVADFRMEHKGKYTWKRTNFGKIKYDPQVMIISPTVLPTDKVFLANQASQAAQLGMIDRKAYLEMTNIPNAEEIDSRMEAKEQKMLSLQIPTEQRPDPKLQAAIAYLRERGYPEEDITNIVRELGLTAI